MADVNYTLAAAFLIPHKINASSDLGSTFTFFAVLVITNALNLINGVYSSGWLNAEHDPRATPDNRRRLRALFLASFCLLQIVLAIYYRSVIVNDNLTLSIILFLGAGICAPAIIDAIPFSKSQFLYFKGAPLPTELGAFSRNLDD